MHMAQRTTAEVLRDHLELAQRGEVDTDIERNFSPKCVLLTTYGIFRGHEGVREAAALLERQVGKTHYAYRTTMAEGDVGFLEWTAEGAGVRIDDGADSYLIREGLIDAMTIHYTLTHKPASAQASTA